MATRNSEAFRAQGTPRTVAASEEPGRGAETRIPLHCSVHANRVQDLRAVFVNEGQKGLFRTVKLDRRYKTEDGEWHSASSFSAGQLAAVLAVSHQALAFVMEQEQVEDE